MSAQDLETWRNRCKPGMPLFPGPSEVREAFILAKGIDWTASYIDPAVWIPSSKTVITRTNYAHDEIKRNASFICEKLGLKVCRPQQSQRAAA